MINLKKIFSAGAVLASLTAISLNAIEPWNVITVDGGWRYETLDSHVKYTEKTTTSNGPKTTELGHENLKIKDINVMRFGGKLWASTPEGCFDDCDGELWWLSQLYMRGHAYYGWVGNSGQYHNNQVYVSPEKLDNKYHAKIHKGNSFDGSIALGFMYPICDEWGIGPVGGWSYDRLRVSTKDAKNNGADFPAEDGMRMTSTFKGPFVGIDFFYDLCECDLSIAATYEYHWASWKFHKRLKGPDSDVCGPYSQERTASNGHGNRFYIDTRYTLCECWDLGLGFEYNYFFADEGSARPSKGSFEDVGCPANEKNPLGKTKWQTFGLTFGLGYRF